MKRLRQSLAFLKRLDLPKSSETPAPENPKQRPDEDEERQNQRKDTTSIAEQINLPLRDLAEQIRALVHQLDTNAQEDQQQQNKRQNEQLALQKCIRTVSIVSTGLTFIVGILTVLILDKTLGVYGRQTELTRVGLMPQVIVAGLSVAYHQNGNANLLVTNVGHSNATDVTIAIKEQDRGHMPDSFDPFADDMDRSAKARQKITQFLNDEQREIADIPKHFPPNRQAEWVSDIHKGYKERRRLAREEANPTPTVAQITDLPKGQSASYTLGLKIQTVAMSAGGRSLFLYGTVSYCDPTDDNKRTYRQFCWRYDTLEQVSSDCLRLQTQPTPKAKNQ